ncbi:MAG: hypothetical protein ACRBCS_12040 [Cellvibrionaceae bacterium]
MEEKILTAEGQECLQQLLQVWFKFERDLNRVPIIRRLEQGTFTKKDYLNLLLNLRQQVIEGSRWITRCASSFDRDFADVRSVVISHASDEHKDYEILEKDYIASGGQLAEITHIDRNLGTEALHAFLMYRATYPNPVDLIGAMWIIEGLGEKMAKGWSERIIELVGEKNCSVTFMSYHSANDEDHMEKLYSLIDRVCTKKENIKAIVRTAKVVSRLYALQLEEIDND